MHFGHSIERGKALCELLVIKLVFKISSSSTRVLIVSLGVQLKLLVLKYSLPIAVTKRKKHPKDDFMPTYDLFALRSFPSLS